MKQHCPLTVREPAQRAAVSEALHSPAQSLPAGVRKQMEQRFDHDFGSVRIHAGDEAARSADAVQAKAFTLGRDVAFGKGRYQPHTSTGEALIAHELEHVAHGASPGADSMQVLRAPQDPATPAVAPKPTVDSLTTKIKDLLSALTGYEFKQEWSHLEAQIITPVTTGKVRASLRDETLVKDLKSMTAAERTTIAKNVHDNIVKTLTGVEAADVTTEYDAIRKYAGFENGEPGFVMARTALLNKFGTLDAATKYYKALKPAHFPDDTHKTPVHENLQKKLAAAKTLLTTKGWLKDVTDSIETVGGFNVRENRKNTSQLSDHSYGWAVDINAKSNPFFQDEADFPNTMIKGFTGVDMFKGEEMKKVRAGGTADEQLVQVNLLKTASNTFRDSFKDETTLQAALVKYLGDNDLTLTKEDGTELFTKVKTHKQKDVSAYLSLKKLGPAPKEPEPAPGTPPPKKKPAKPKDPVWENAADLAKFLIAAHVVYTQTLQKDKKTPIEQSGTGSPRMAAAHGFINLKGELIAALTASDGGNLRWLGDQESDSKDFHHFQLKDADRPVITKATPAAPATK